MPESEKKFLCVKCGLLTKSCTPSRAPRTSSSQIITQSRLMMNLSPEVTGSRTIRAVSWNTWEKQDDLIPTQQSEVFTFWSRYIFKQMLARMKTSLQKAKRQDVNYVRAPLCSRLLQLLLLFDKGLVFSPISLNLTFFDPPPFQKPIQQKTKKMQRRVVVPANVDCRAKTIQSLSNLGTGSYGGQHRVREFLQ